MTGALYEDADGLWRLVPRPRPLRVVVRGALLNALAWSHGDQRRAAHALGISSRALGYQLKKYGIPSASTAWQRRR